MRWRRATTPSRLFSSGLCLAALCGAAVLLLREPAWRGYPRCTLVRVTGLYCPGCGSLRAAHALAHGRVHEAAAWNPLLMVLSPLLAAWMALHAVRVATGKELPAPRIATWLAVALATLVIGFGILRNLPPRGSNPLRPHDIRRAPPSIPALRPGLVDTPEP